MNVVCTYGIEQPGTMGGIDVAYQMNAHPWTDEGLDPNLTLPFLYFLENKRLLLFIPLFPFCFFRRPSAYKAVGPTLVECACLMVMPGSSPLPPFFSFFTAGRYLNNVICG